MLELEQARKERDEAFTEFIEHTAKADKHSQKAKGARAKYMLANDTVRALERDVLAYPVGSLNHQQ